MSDSFTLLTVLAVLVSMLAAMTLPAMVLVLSGIEKELRRIAKALEKEQMTKGNR